MLDNGAGTITGMIGARIISRLKATIVGVSNIVSQLIGHTSISDINWMDVGISTAVGDLVGLIEGV